MVYQRLLRPLLFGLTQHDPEVAHDLALALLAPLSRLPQAWLTRAFGPKSNPKSTLPRPNHPLTVCGLTFPSPVGLAAGFDKDGLALPFWAALGFGFVEVGTVTWHAQPGNPRPRIFRFPHSQALINRMGFNNQGAVALAARLQKLPPLPIPLGISLGKSRITPLEEAPNDYAQALRVLAPYAAYFALNVSSPNTPGLRSLQDRAHLEALVTTLQREVKALPPSPSRFRQQPDAPIPLLIKVAPDLSEQALLEVLEVCERHHISGIIATNTTLSRTGLAATTTEAGGLSGRPLAARALEVVSFISHQTQGKLPIIGVGGILTSADAQRMLAAGASLIQIYTGFVYHGPTFIHSLNTTLKD